MADAPGSQPSLRDQLAAALRAKWDEPRSYGVGGPRSYILADQLLAAVPDLQRAWDLLHEAIDADADPLPAPKGPALATWSEQQRRLVPLPTPEPPPPCPDDCAECEHEELCDLYGTNVSIVEKGSDDACSWCGRDHSPSSACKRVPASPIPGEPPRTNLEPARDFPAASAPRSEGAL